ncbi:hypothetical protein F5887DRAFT_1074773 [Amanita rubescens]|nr:hypothetical protein F5887DRAFT_1074773 [Amanita rubescens]
MRASVPPPKLASVKKRSTSGNQKSNLRSLSSVLTTFGAGRLILPTNPDWNFAVKLDKIAQPLRLLPFIVHHVGQAWQPAIVLAHNSILTPTPYWPEHETYTEPERRKLTSINRAGQSRRNCP